MLIAEEVRNLITERRKRNLLTYKDLAKLLGVTQEKNIIKYVSGKLPITYKMLYRLSKALDLDYEMLSLAQLFNHRKEKK